MSNNTGTGGNLGTAMLDIATTGAGVSANFPPLATPARITEMMQRENDDLRIRNQDLRAREQIAKEANDAMRADVAAALKLVADIRFALGDNGRRMQDELIAWCKDLANTEALCAELRDAVFTYAAANEFREAADHPAWASTPCKADAEKAEVQAFNAMMLKANATPATMGEEVARLKALVNANQNQAAGDMANALCEASRLANSIWRSEYKNDAPNWQPLGTVVGVISQIDNMYAGVREQRDALRQQLAERDAEVARKDAALKWASGEAKGRLPEWFHAAIGDQGKGWMNPAEADVLRARVSELERELSIRKQLLNAPFVPQSRLDAAEARNERLVAALRTCKNHNYSDGLLHHQTFDSSAVDAALADNGGATAGDVSTSSTRPAEVSKNGAGIDTGATHRLKTWPPYFIKVESGEKPFEVRLNDRGYKVGDTLILEEWDRIQEHYTGRTLTRTVTYVMEGPGFGLAEGYVVLALDTPHPDSPRLDWLIKMLLRYDVRGLHAALASTGEINGDHGNTERPILDRCSIDSAMQAAKERALTDAVRDNAERWWGGPGAPIATSEAETMRCFVPVKQEAKP